MTRTGQSRSSGPNHRQTGSTGLLAEEGHASVSLFVLVGWLALFWAALRVLVGWPPRFPPLSGVWPTWSTIQVWLNSAILPTDWMIPVVGIVAWLLWGWTCLFVLLRLLLNILETVTRGARWVRSLRQASNWMMIPAVRHAVDVSLAGLLVARVAAVPAIASAQAEAPFAVVALRGVERGDDRHAPSIGSLNGVMLHEADSDTLADPAQADDVIHTVCAGETWASISRLYFGSLDLAEQLLEANVGRWQTGGVRITRHGLISEGQTVRIPTALGTSDRADQHRRVTVQPGDTLWGISARDLGDGRRWPDIYDLSKGAIAPDGHVLRNPNLIWPGLVVDEPIDEPPSDRQPQDASADDDSASQPGQLAAEESTPPAATPTVPAADATAVPEPTSVPTAVAQIASEPVSSPESTDRWPPATTPSPSQPAQDAPTESEASEPRHTLVSPAVGAGVGGALGLAGLAGTALVLRRRHPRPRRTRSESDDEVRAGFAEIEPTGDAGEEQLTDDLDTAARIASRLSGALAAVLLEDPGQGGGEVPTRGAVLAGLRHGRSSTTLLVQAVPMAARGRLIAALPAAATRAFGERSDVEGMVSRDGDVLVRLSGVAEDVRTPGQIEAGTQAGVWPEPSLLLRLGLLADGQIFAANWDAIGHVLVAAPLGQGAEAVLGGLLAGLVARRPPTQLGLLVIGSPRSLPDELLGLPHTLGSLVDPHDEAAALDALRSVREELERRMSSGRTDAPDLVLVVTELGQLGTDHMAALGSIMLQGPRYRLRVLAASTRRAVDLAQHCPVLAEFGTRLVLRTPDEEDSIALLGSVDGTELGPGGHLLARLEGRVPLQAHGYRAAPDRLVRLAAAIRGKAAPADWWRPPGASEHPGPPLETETVVAASVEPEAETEPGPGSRAEGQGEQMESVELPPEPGEDAPRAEPGNHGPDDIPAPGEADEREVELAQATPEVDSPRALEHPQLELTQPRGSPPSSVEAGSLPDVVSSRGAHEAQARRNGLHSEASARPRLRGRFFGARELLYDGKVVWPTPGEPEESAMELLVFLAVQDPSGVRSELLGDSFWEEDDDEARADRLKKRRYRLRLALKKFVPGLEGDPLARMDKQNPVHRLNPAVIESDVHRFLKLVDDAKRLPPDEAIAAYEEALELYRGDLLDRPDVPPYRWLDEGPRLVDLRVKYATMRQQARRRLADLLATGTGEQLARAEELYILLAGEDPLDHRLWEALFRLHGRRNDLLGLEATMRRLRSALLELGEGDDPERVLVPPALARVFAEVRASLLGGRIT